MEEDNFFDEMPRFAQDGDEEDPVLRPHKLTSDDVQRMSSHIRPFPLSDVHTPTEWDGFDGISDEVLMDAPPQLIAHMQRTAAQGGFQVVSPRQTPLCAMLGRVNTGQRQIGDHIVGSTAERSTVWPTLDNYDPSHDLPHEPLPDKPQDHGLREKTRTLPLTSASHLLSDPILSCLVKGRAVIDILRRDDVQGGADEMMELLADAWGVSVEDLSDLDAYSLGVEGDLLRHAIKADEVYPTIYSPIHQRRCISVGANDVTREYLPLDSAWDWRRMRVLAEAIFAMSVNIEGYPYVDITARPPPGDPNAPLSRPNILAFRPLPCTVWWAGASSFSIMPVPTEFRKKMRTIPKEVLSALARYTEVVKPMARVMDIGFMPSTRATHITNVIMPTGETLSSAYTRITSQIMTNPARGKQPAAAVRNYIFEAIESAPLPVRLRLTRYLSIAREECRIHLMHSKVPDEVVDSIAMKFLKVGNNIRLKVQLECSRRGYSQEEAWHDFVSQAPQRYKVMTEGSAAWAKAAFYLLFTEPTQKWHNLAHAVKMESLRNSAKASVGTVALPPKKGSGERLLAAVRYVAKQITMNFYGYYVGSADVAMAIADRAESIGRPTVANLMRESAYLWYLRARAFRGTNVNPRAHDQPNTSNLHFRVAAEPMDLVLAPNPYRAYTAYRNHALGSVNVSKEAKSVMLEKRQETMPVSQIFTEMRHPICLGRKTDLTAYALSPQELGVDMERAWGMLVADIKDVATRMMAECDPPQSIPYSQVIEVEKMEVRHPTGPMAAQMATGTMSYFDLLSRLPIDAVDALEDRLDEMPDPVSEMITSGRFATVEEMFRTVDQLEREIEADTNPTGETVR